MSPSDPRFPPAYAPRAVVTDEDVVRLAIEGARSGDLGAGDLLWSLRTTHAQAAIVLEPEVPFSEAVQAVPLLMVSIADALGAIGPPNLAVTLRWPQTVLVNGADVGRVGLWVPPETGADDIPPRLVVDFSVAVDREEALNDPGLNPGTTVLFEEGCGDLDRSQILGAVARHFLARLDEWQEEGFALARRSFLACADGLGRDVEVPLHGRSLQGRMAGLDPSGGFQLDTNDARMVIHLSDVFRRSMQPLAPVS
ncbi:Bifunctional protein BirA [Hartmannibacter diazotrophicus]|uniref:Bifunctional protein BirA n=1 Tax=Hartmannibacter diazotrophicus TaxID=1482074 RepID=A0A2C9D4Z2_9HYPH|nr:biotin/lipoate--protein ligase family protein [Hartmannibacter diazotrophicus]SON55293.1 Bifunctional protein BirA [Hartmannibacter diazotrophicus]